MGADTAVAVAALNRRFLLDYPREAAARLEDLPDDEAAALLAGEPVHVAAPVWDALSPDREDALLARLPAEAAARLVAALAPARAAALLRRLEATPRAALLARLDPAVARELGGLLAYPPDTAGALMDPRVTVLRGDLPAAAALARLRERTAPRAREIYVAGGDGRIEGRVAVEELAVAEPGAALAALARPLAASVQELAPREEAVERFERARAAELPVLDFEGRAVGVIRQSALVAALQAEATVDIQTMVGASRDERALSPAGFAVRMRLPWLEINLLTAFLAASVVGLFEGTIAKFTALAVLLPVVAGQSGNAGAQALAVTMRGLALREIGVRHWPRVVGKEVTAGALNGIAIALTTAAGVYVWSRSPGLAGVIAIAMVVSMVAAGFAGAVIPILLTRAGQDPAQSSSIVLTTITDITGFFSFLGTATLLQRFL